MRNLALVLALCGVFAGIHVTFAAETPVTVGLPGYVLFSASTNLRNPDGSVVRFDWMFGESILDASLRFCTDAVAAAHGGKQACAKTMATTVLSAASNYIESHSDILADAPPLVHHFSGILPEFLQASGRRAEAVVRQDTLTAMARQTIIELRQLKEAVNAKSGASATGGVGDVSGPDGYRRHSCSDAMRSLPAAALEPASPDAPLFLKGLDHRREFPLLLNALGLKGPGVEIGVWRGDFSKILLSGWNTTAPLHLVDVWERTVGYEFDRNYDFEMTKRNVEAFGARAVIHKGDSTLVSAEFPDEHFDYIYIDALHSYHEALNDITVWYPKLKVGGIISGDDYYNGFVPDAGRVFGVRDAVDAFTQARGIRLYTTRHDDHGGYTPNWYFMKC